MGNSVNYQFFGNCFYSRRFTPLSPNGPKTLHETHTLAPLFVWCGFFLSGVCCLTDTDTRGNLCLCLAGRVRNVSTGGRSARSLSRGNGSPACWLKLCFFFFFFSFFLFFCLCVAAQQQKNSGDTCPCETPCNLTRYGKELSMVKIPSKGSARYLSRKYDKSEDYIRYDGLRAEGDDQAPAQVVMQRGI